MGASHLYIVSTSDYNWRLFGREAQQRVGTIPRCLDEALTKNREILSGVLNHRKR
jgi:hypothetical protein